MTKKSAARKTSDTLKSAASKVNLDVLAAMEQRWNKKMEEVVAEWQMMLRLASAATIYSSIHKTPAVTLSLPDNAVIVGSFGMDDVNHMTKNNDVEFTFNAEQQRWYFKITPKPVAEQEKLDV